jgi:putative aldouronate transport system substrate-binding protein
LQLAASITRLDDAQQSRRWNSIALADETGANTTTMQSKGGILVKLEGNTFINMIYGKKPVAEFNNFVKDWKSLGGDDITKEVNEWYKKSK